MKITASKKDEILQRKAKYEADRAAYDERQQGYAQAYRQAENEVLNPIREYLERKLSRFDALQFDITARRGWNMHNHEGADVYIRCNEHNKFDDDSALSWSYEVKLDSDGNVVRESSSWSGLKATTEEQMRSLRQTVSALDFLNDVDWDELIKVNMPDYSDYYNPEDKAPEREDFESQLKQAELEEIVGQDAYVKVKNWGESCPYRGDVYLKILKETPSMYQAVVIPAYLIDDYDRNPESYLESVRQYSNYTPYRVRKSSIRLTNPIKVARIEGDELIVE